MAFHGLFLEYRSVLLQSAILCGCPDTVAGWSNCAGNASHKGQCNFAASKERVAIGHSDRGMVCPRYGAIETRPYFR